MADSAISDLTNLPSALTSGDKFEVVRSGVNYQADADDLPASGGGLSWSQVISESGASFSNFTNIAGTWASTGSIIQQTDTSANERVAAHNTMLGSGMAIVECELRVPSGTSGVRIAGIGFYGTPGATEPVAGSNRTLGRPAWVLQRSGGSWTYFPYSHAVIAGPSFSATATEDTWYKLRIVRAGGYVYSFDGTEITVTADTNTYRSESHLGLYAYADVDFRNIKAWVADLGLPS